MTTEFGDEIRRRLDALGWDHSDLANAMTVEPNDAYATATEAEWQPHHIKFKDVVLLADALDAPLAHLLRLSGCALPPGLALVGQLSMSSREQALFDALEGLLERHDDDGCEYDRNGFCQVHYCGRPCSVEEARKTVAAIKEQQP